MTGPFVVVDYCCFPLRKVCAVDPQGVLRFAASPTEGTRYDTFAAADEATDRSCALTGWPRQHYDVLPLDQWEEEQIRQQYPRRKPKPKAAAEVEA